MNQLFVSDADALAARIPNGASVSVRVCVHMCVCVCV